MSAVIFIIAIDVLLTGLRKRGLRPRPMNQTNATSIHKSRHLRKLFFLLIWTFLRLG